MQNQPIPVIAANLVPPDNDPENPGEGAGAVVMPDHVVGGESKFGLSSSSK